MFIYLKVVKELEDFLFIFSSEDSTKFKQEFHWVQTLKFPSLNNTLLPKAKKIRTYSVAIVSQRIWNRLRNHRSAQCSHSLYYLLARIIGTKIFRKECGDASDSKENNGATATGISAKSAVALVTKSEIATERTFTLFGASKVNRSKFSMVPNNSETEVEVEVRNEEYFWRLRIRITNLCNFRCMSEVVVEDVMFVRDVVSDARSLRCSKSI